MLDTLGPARSQRRKRQSFKYLPPSGILIVGRYIYTAVLEEDSKGLSSTEGGMRDVILNKVQTLEHEIRLLFQPCVLNSFVNVSC